MTHRHFGILNLIFLGGALGMALGSMGQQVPRLALVYGFGGIPLTVILLVGIYCTKCTAPKERCSHILPGLLRPFLPRRPEGPYRWEKGLLLAGAAVFVLVPQPWLWRTPLFFALFWIFLVTAAGIQYFGACPHCRHRHCILKPRK